FDGTLPATTGVDATLVTWKLNFQTGTPEAPTGGIRGNFMDQNMDGITADRIREDRIRGVAGDRLVVPTPVSWATVTLPDLGPDIHFRNEVQELTMNATGGN